MSQGNWFFTKEKAFVLRTKILTTSSTLTTYTAKTGTVATTGLKDGSGVIDRVIKVITTSGNNITITVPNGLYSGQQLLIIFQTEGSDETVTLTPDSGSLTNLTAATGYSSLEWINSSVGWVVLSHSAT